MEERIESQSVYNGKLFQVFKDRVRLPNGNATTREIVRHPGSVAIVPRHKDGRVVLVRVPGRYRRTRHQPAGVCAARSGPAR